MDGETGLKVDPQNPLPEPSFFWRRVIALAVTGTTLLLTWHNLEALHDLRDSAGLLNLSKWVLSFAALVLTYYFVAPSAAELTALIQSAKIIRGSQALAAMPVSPENPPAQPLLPTQGSSATPAPLLAPVAPVSGDDEDAAPRGRS
jgi:hypothetical protein